MNEDGLVISRRALTVHPGSDLEARNDLFVAIVLVARQRTARSLAKPCQHVSSCLKSAFFTDHKLVLSCAGEGMTSGG
jgi:hypothetical protein